MKLSVPVHQLKRRARALSREAGIPLNKALDHIARREGFHRWSLLAAKATATTHASRLLVQLSPGDLVLLGARPGHGKTLMGLKLIVEAIKLGHQGIFFTMEYTEADVIHRFRTAGGDISALNDLFEFDNSDAINSNYIIDRLAGAQRGTVIVVDYLQLLDQKRSSPELMVQIRALKAFARDNGLIIVFIAQIDRSYDAKIKPCPDLGDVRLPNPLDLSLFDKSCFLNDSRVHVESASPP